MAGRTSKKRSTDLSVQKLRPPKTGRAEDMTLAELYRELGPNEARTQALRERACNDPEIVEVVRLRAWARYAPGRVRAVD